MTLMTRHARFLILACALLAQSSARASNWGFQGLGNLTGGNFDSYATGVSADGSVVVGQDGYATSRQEAFFWTAASGMVSIESLLTSHGVDLAGWRLHNANAVSADGRTIVGWGTNPSGQSEAWLATVPEPSTLLLGALGMVGLLWRKRRKQPF